MIYINILSGGSHMIIVPLLLNIKHPLYIISYMLNVFNSPKYYIIYGFYLEDLTWWLCHLRQNCCWLSLLGSCWSKWWCCVCLALVLFTCSIIHLGFGSHGRSCKWKAGGKYAIIIFICLER